MTIEHYIQEKKKVNLISYVDSCGEKVDVKYNGQSWFNNCPIIFDESDLDKGELMVFVSSQEEEVLSQLKLYHLVFNELQSLPPMSDEEIVETLRKLQSLVFEESVG